MDFRWPRAADSRDRPVRHPRSEPTGGLVPRRIPDCRLENHHGQACSVFVDRGPESVLKHGP